MASVRGKVVVVTGGSHGIGLESAREIARRGGRVVLAARHADALESAAEELRAGGRAASYVRMDVTSDDDVREGVARVESDVGPIAVWVNNAGGARQGLVASSPLDALRAEFELNYFGALRAIREVAPRMQARRSGCIVNVASVLGFVPYATMANYGAAKAAILSLTQALRTELEPFGIEVLAFAPGHTRTRAIERIRLEGPRVQRPEQVGRALADAIEAGRRLSIAGFGNRLFVRASRVFPGIGESTMRHFARLSFPDGALARGEVAPAP
jgi:3-oxoacyl-[acyl-carrier protein] reductase